MGFRSNGTDIGSKLAAVDLTGHQHKFVKFAAGGVRPAAANEQADGILQNKPAAGQPASVRVHGVSKLIASAAIAEGATIGSNADALGVTAVAGTHQGCARALEAAVGAGSVIAAFIEQRGTFA